MPAAGRIEDQALLADLAKTDADCDVRAAAAAGRIEDQLLDSGPEYARDAD